jgi:acyl-CoA thioester hydrolase
MPAWSREFHVGWAHLDANGHMANTAYLDLAADARMMFFAEHGFPFEEFRRAGVGPVIQRETLEYRRELRLLDPVEVSLALAGLSPDGSRWVLLNEFLRKDGQLAASVTSTGGWLDLGARALTPPPLLLADALRRAPRSPSWVELPDRTP